MSLPVRMLYSRQSSAGAPYEDSESIEFSNWRLNAPLPDAAFHWAPPAGAVEVPAINRSFIGTPVPAIHVEKWGGGGVDFADFQGKMVVIYFWSPSDGESRKALSKIQEVLGKPAGAGVAVVAVCIDEDRAVYEKWVSTHGKEYPFTFAYDPAGKGLTTPIRKQFGIRYIPSTFIVGPDGRMMNGVLGMYGGYVDDLTNRLDRARAAGANAAPTK